jgi:murein DD-endopeptidase MepM/ murein hydrolase activator NlpD
MTARASRRSYVAGALLSGLLATATATAAQTDAEAAAVARARAREEFLAKRSAEAEAAARGQALAAYRLARKRSAAFLDSPGRRTSDARALDAALLVLGRSLQEASTLEQERARTAAECRALEANRNDDRTDAALPHHWERRFHIPARGASVAAPGIRRDEATGAQTRLAAVELLARLDEPVHAVAAGEIRKVAALPQGGFAIVTAHEDGWVSILSGLREVAVAPGANVAAGSRLGGVGRNLDGAPVLTFALVHAGAPVDPTPVLGGHRAPHEHHHHGRHGR